MYKNFLVYNKHSDAIDANSLVTPMRGNDSEVKNGVFANLRSFPDVDTAELDMIRNTCFVSFLLGGGIFKSYRVFLGILKELLSYCIFENNPFFIKPDTYFSP